MDTNLKIRTTEKVLMMLPHDRMIPFVHKPRQFRVHFHAGFVLLVTNLSTYKLQLEVICTEIRTSLEKHSQTSWQQRRQIILERLIFLLVPVMFPYNIADLLSLYSPYQFHTVNYKCSIVYQALLFPAITVFEPR